MSLNIYLAAFLFFYIAAYSFYLKISRGLSKKAKYLQLRRFFPCALLAVLPAALVQLPPDSGLYLGSFLTGLAWIITYPSLYCLTNRKVSNDFGFHLDFVFGLYLIAWLTSLEILVLAFNLLPRPSLALISLAEFILLLIPLFQCCYFFLYGTCVDTNGMLLILETDYNEIIEFIKSLPKKFVFLTVLAAGLLLSFLTALNLTSLNVLPPAPAAISLLITAAVFLFLTFYLWKNRLGKRSRGVFVRTGIIELTLDTRKYLETSKLYVKNMEERLQDLTVTPDKPSFDRPSTVIVIIGESASRDYMSAFTDCPYDSTPWLRQKKDDPHFILFPHTYSCATATVPVLERALTEFSQYNDGEFYTSVSLIDIARKAGYKTSWFSNQGHLGSADTPVTLIAETADTARWNLENLSQVRYDETILEYLDEVDPMENNFVILHLRGSHFNFLNRYPKEFTRWGEPGRYDLILNYVNSHAYTDYVLEKIHAYAKEKLNLQALIYFSDHAMLPDKRRSPNFSGFATTRIPMFTYFSDEYMEKNKSVYETLKLHEDYYFTNDLVYELVCSILGITSNHFDETGSLASPEYKYTRETLKTDVGKLFIRDDASGG